MIFLGSLGIADAQYFNGGAGNQFIQLGWNFGYVHSCATIDDGANTWHYAFFPDGGYAITNNPGFSALLAAVCQTGNVAAIHVYSLNPFRWNAAIGYPFQ
jgi:hypothetical protein